MATPNTDADLEAQPNSVTEAQLASPPLIADTANPQLPTSPDPQTQVTNTNGHHEGNNPAPQIPENPQVQRDENHGDPSDGLWSMYLTEAEKEDTEVTENWNGDTNGILVFTGLFSATVAAFIIESYKMLSPDSGVTTNEILTQLSTQLFNISNGIPLASVSAQSVQPFKPTASAIRVNVLWFLSLILSLNCALSATLMQQWARRYRELAQRRGAFHRRGRMRAYIFDGINRFGMARAIATMPTLLHISVFLFFAGLIDFLFPIHATVAYAAVGCVGVFALAYAILTVLPIIYLNCPYATPLSGFTWRISQFSVFVFLWTILEIQCLVYCNSSSKLWRLAKQYTPGTHRLKKWWKTLSRFIRSIPGVPVFVYNWAVLTICGLYRKSLSKLRGVVDKRTPETHGRKTWWEILDKRVKIRHQRFSQSLRKTAELSAYKAKSTVITSALEWTFTALDEDKEIEDFAARVPGFFDSRVVPDATSAVLSLMSHQPNTDPIFGSRLCDLLETCVSGTSLLDEKMRKHRLWVCVKCLWYFGRAYNRPGVSQPLPPYFPNSLIPKITSWIQTEEDPALRVIGRCVVAVIINKLAADLKSSAIPVDKHGLASLSGILGTSSGEPKFLIREPDAIALANMISFAFGEVGTLVADGVPRDVLDAVQQTLTILSQALPAQENTEPKLEQSSVIFNGIDGKFKRLLVSRLLDFLNTCLSIPSGLTETEEVRTTRASCVRACLKGLWYFGLAFNQLGRSVTLSSFICLTFANPEMTRRIHEQHDLATSMIGRCVGALVVNKLAADIKSRDVPASNDELECISAVLGTKIDDVKCLLSHPGAIEFTNMVFLTLEDRRFYFIFRVPLYVLDILQQTSGVLSQALPPALNTKMRLNQADSLMDVSNGTLSLGREIYQSVLRLRTKSLWDFTREYNEPESSVPLPSYICIAFTNPEMTRRMHQESDLATRVIGCCVGALVVNNLAAGIKSRNVPASNDELACLSAILGTGSDDVMLLLSHPGAIEVTNMVFLASEDLYFDASAEVPSYVLDAVQQTSSALSQALPPPLNTKMRLNETDTTVNVSDGTSSLRAEMYRRIFRAWMKNLWDFTREYNKPKNSLPLPSYVCVAFTNPEMTRRIRKQFDLIVRVTGRCVGVLVVNKLTHDHMFHTVPASDAELACLSTILDTEVHNVRLCLSQPATINLVNMASLALDNLSPFFSYQMPPDTRYVLQRTLGTLSQALLAQGNAELPQDQTVASVNVSDDRSGRTVVSCLQGLFNMCLPGTSSLVEEVRTSCLRMCLKSLWHCANAHKGTFDRFSSNFLPVFAWLEITRHFQTEQDPVARITGFCVGALIVSRLADPHKSPISLSGHVRDPKMACISVILGTEHRDVLFLPHQLHIINFRNVVSLISREIDALSTAAGTPADTLNVAQDTLYTLANRICHEAFGFSGLSFNKRGMLKEIFSDVVNTLRSDQLKHETGKTLDLLKQILERLLPGVE